ncbi:hypothetical protein TW82_12140 [Pseudoalteromonas fuliginea]|uniref:Transposase n=1 Tax=Pseudoalteromonas fuliginea TaxID=1872678 RepID=A0ABD3YCT0_9GAMM|nr:hypothetical protein DC53_02760 [Pseudoalteromonas fuliginea]KJZ27500.1 hypothetical protein TW82_12140 [Pseudoalteromonas fuliginea]
MRLSYENKALGTHYNVFRHHPHILLIWLHRAEKMALATKQPTDERPTIKQTVHTVKKLKMYILQILKKVP